MRGSFIQMTGGHGGKTLQRILLQALFLHFRLRKKVFLLLPYIFIGKGSLIFGKFRVYFIFSFHPNLF